MSLVTVIELVVCMYHTVFEGCSSMRDDRMIMVRHDDVVPLREGGVCRRCQCNDGTFECNPPTDAEATCDRSDPRDNDRPQNCMMDGEMLMHNEQREVSTSR